MSKHTSARVGGYARFSRPVQPQTHAALPIPCTSIISAMIGTGVIR
jgi:hypothetical protein